jgi:PAS domain S-box-containing protein
MFKVIIMKKSQDEFNEIFEPITKDGLSKEIPTEFACDTLSIIVDALNSSNGGLIITNREGIIQYANPSFYKIFEYLSSEIIGTDAVELFAIKEVRSLTDIIFFVDFSKEGTVESVVKKKDDTNIIVEVSASNATSASGEIIGRMASFIDITKRKKIESDREQLIKKHQLKPSNSY